MGLFRSRLLAVSRFFTVLTLLAMPVVLVMAIFGAVPLPMLVEHPSLFPGMAVA